MTPSLDALVRLILTSRVYDVAHETPLEPAPRLSRRLRNDIVFKREDLQPVFSFKLRGAYNRIAALTDAERRAGVITASAGNHAQGVAFAARHLSLSALIVMPQTTPDIKVRAVQDLGAEVVLVGDSYADAKARCDALAVETGRVFIHPFDDLLVIAGQGTVAAEIVGDRLGEVSAIFVPVGGGGLIAGIGAYLKALRPEVRIIGVEPFEADAMYRSLAAGRRVVLDHVGIFADGVAVREVGERTFAIARETVDEMVRVSNDEICGAIKDVFDDTRTIMEPAGALGLAGLKSWVAREGVRAILTPCGSLERCSSMASVRSRSATVCRSRCGRWPRTTRNSWSSAPTEPAVCSRWVIANPESDDARVIHAMTLRPKVFRYL